MRSVVFAGIVLVGISSIHTQAQIVVMDYQGNPIGDAPALYVEDGIQQIAATQSPSDSTQFNTGNPSPGYMLNSAAGHVIWSLENGDPFNFVSVDLFTQTDNHTVLVTVNYDDGAIAVFPVVSGPSFQTYAPIGGFNEVASIELDVPPNAGLTFIDNFTIAIPEPTTLAALGAIGVLALRRW